MCDYIYSIVIFFFCFVFLNINDNNKLLKTIIIVFCKGYKKNTLYSFFASLAKQSPYSHLLLFSDNVTIKYVRNLLNKNKVIGINILDVYPYYPSTHKLYPISQQFLFRHIPERINKSFNFFYHIIRFFLANVWLKKYGNSYKYILLCDVRDILFQKNPFTFYNKNGLYLQEEIFNRKGEVGIKADIWNYKWIKPYRPINDIILKPIINSGQVLGCLREIKFFLSEFCVFLNITHINTAEQGSMNYFIYSKIYKRNLYIKKHGYGFALLMHCPLYETVENYTPVNNYIYNYDGSIPPIIHAYQLGLKYGSKNRIIKYKEFISYHTKLSL